jgi:hypothetical protein
MIMAEYIAISPDGTKRNRVVLPDDYDMSRVPPGVRLEPIQGYVGKLPAEPNRPFQMGLGESFIEGTQDPPIGAEQLQRHARGASDVADYDRYVREREQNLRDRGVRSVPRFVGNLASPMMLIPEVASAPAAAVGSVAQRVGAGAITGALGGATTPKTGEDYATEEILGTAAGAAGGAALGRLGAAGSARRAPTSANALDAASQIYDQLQQSGATISRQTVRNLADTIEQQLNSRLFDRQSAPGTFRALDRLRTMDWKQHPFQDATIADLDQFSQFLRDQLGYRDRDSSAASAALDIFDNYISNIPQGAIRSGDPQRDVQLLRRAQELWRAGRRAQAIEDASWGAELRIGSTGTGANVANVYRQEARRLLTGPQGRLITDPATREALEAIARGTTLQNVARYLGKVFAPSGSVSSLPYRLGKEGVTAKTVEAGMGLFMKEISDRLSRYAMRHEADRILSQTGLPTRPPSPLMRTFQPAALGGTAAGVLSSDFIDALAPKSLNDGLR